MAVERRSVDTASASANMAVRNLVIERIFAAPRGLVFKAWTDPEHVARWWGPNGFTNPLCELDVRPAAPSASTCADPMASCIQ